MSFFKRPAFFVFLEHTQSGLGRSHCCRSTFQVIMVRKRKELRNAIRLTCLFFKHDYRIWKLRIICSRIRSVLMWKSSAFLVPGLTSFGLATALGKMSFSKQKLNQSASMPPQIAMNIFYDLMMQCLHYICAMFMTKLPY